MQIKNTDDFKKADERLNLSKISSEEIEIIGVDDIYDGPLSGDCLWNNDRYYFFTFDQLEDDGVEDRWPRKYLLVKLTPEQIAEKEKAHIALCKWEEGVISEKEYQQIYTSSDCVINKEQIVGWFDDGKTVSGTVK